MSDPNYEPFIGQLAPFAFNFAPRGWALCNGQILSIQQNTALFSLLGTTYGGNGQTTFGLPDLRGRVPMHWDTNYPQGAQAGEISVTLSVTNMPAHNHALYGTSSAANSKQPVTGSAYAQSPAEAFYAAPGTGAALNPATVASVGLGQAHNNVQPYLTINWCIALEGIYPSRN